MGLSKTPDGGWPAQPLQHSLALLVPLVCRNEIRHLQRYLDWASKLIEDMLHNSKQCEGCGAK